MSSNAIATLQDYILEFYAVLGDVVLSTFLFGILTVLSTVSTGYLIRRGIRRPSTIFMLCSVSVLYASTAVQFGTIVAYSVGYGGLLNDAAAAVSSTSAADVAVAKFGRAAKTESYIISASLAINVTIGDIIVWWRACVLWRKKSIITLGVVLIVGTFGLGIASIIHRSSQLDTYPHLRFLFTDVYGRVSGLASLLTNVMATSLIGWKAWEHKQILRQGLGVSMGRWNTPAIKMLSLLVESGVLYCAILAIAAVEIAVERSKPSLASSTQFVSLARVFLDGGCFIPILAIYPTIIFVVALNASLIEGTALVAASPSALPTDILHTVRSSHASDIHVSRRRSTRSFCPDSAVFSPGSLENTESTEDSDPEECDRDLTSPSLV